jgi:hypothetical protein
MGNNGDDTDNLKDYIPGARLCSKQAAGELFFTNFFHSLGNLSGFGSLIDSKVTTDHYHALEQRQAQFQQALDDTRWKVITTLMNTDADLSKDITDALISLSTLLNIQNDLNKKKVQDELNLDNFICITSTIFLYLIAFVLILFVRWK